MTTITLMTRGNRSGTFTTPSYTVPVGTTGTWLLRANMLESDLAATGLSGSIEVQSSADGGGTWQAVGRLTWESGYCTYPFVTTHNPGIGGPIEALAGKAVRAVVALTSTTRVGFALEVTT